MALEFTYQDVPYRAQVDYLQIFPSKQEIHLVVKVFDTQDYDFRDHAYVVGGAEFLALASVPAIADVPIGHQAVAGAYGWVMEHKIDEIICNGPPPDGYERPTVTDTMVD